MSKISTRLSLVLLLQNLYNAHWPKEFAAQAMVFPGEPDTPFNSAKDIRALDEDDLQTIGMEICILNDKMRLDAWHTCWIQPICILLGWDEIRKEFNSQ